MNDKIIRVSYITGNNRVKKLFVGPEDYKILASKINVIKAAEVRTGALAERQAAKSV